jgi:hypothetical protein
MAATPTWGYNGHMDKRSISAASISTHRLATSLSTLSVVQALIGQGQLTGSRLRPSACYLSLVFVLIAGLIPPSALCMTSQQMSCCAPAESACIMETSCCTCEQAPAGSMTPAAATKTPEPMDSPARFSPVTSILPPATQLFSQAHNHARVKPVVTAKLYLLNRSLLI